MPGPGGMGGPGGGMGGPGGGMGGPGGWGHRPPPPPPRRGWGGYRRGGCLGCMGCTLNVLAGAAIIAAVVVGIILLV